VLLSDDSSGWFLPGAGSFISTGAIVPVVLAATVVAVAVLTLAPGGPARTTLVMLKKEINKIKINAYD
jgi:hypothetical protein